MEAQLRISRVYPSLNRILRMNRWDRTAAKNGFMQHAALEIRALGAPRFKGPVDIRVQMFFKPGANIKLMDGDNYQPKWLLDVLTKLEIIEGDRKKFIPGPVAVDFGHALPPLHEHVVVTIRGI